MAPNRARQTEDSRSESSATTAKNPGGAGGLNTQPNTSKGKRAANNGGAGGHNGGSNLKDVTSAADSAAAGAPAGDTTAVESSYGGVNWTTVDSTVLNAYRHAHGLETPTAFVDFVDQTLLMHPHSVGRFSPTMARHRARRRVPREKLALAIRKDFNAAAVNETDVVTSFLYSIKNEHKHFRMRFGQGSGVTKR